MIPAKTKRGHQPTLSTRIGRQLRYYSPTIAVAVGVIALWEVIVLLFDIKQFLLPKPSAIFRRIHAAGEFMAGAGQGVAIV